MQRFVGLLTFCLGSMAVWNLQPPLTPPAHPEYFLVTLLSPARALAATELGSIPNDCSLLTVRLASDGSLTLNNELNGNVNEMQTLLTRLIGIFEERVNSRMVTPELMNRPDLSIKEKIPNKVIIKADRLVRYGEVAAVIDTVMTSGTKRIFLDIDHLD
jgi:biopolymer transport protein ExbD